MCYYINIKKFKQGYRKKSVAFYVAMNYKNDRWKRKREVILKRDNYLCRECIRYGRRVDATMVHHIWPVEYYPEYEFSNWNLISLCNKCHNKMHDRESHELTQIGLRLMNTHNPPRSRPPLTQQTNCHGNGGGRHFQL